MADNYEVTIDDGGVADALASVTDAAQATASDSAIPLLQDATGADAPLLDATDVDAQMLASEGFVPLDGSVTTHKLADGSVTTPKLAHKAVTGDKIADYTIPDEKLDSTGVIFRVQQLADAMASIDANIDPDDLGLEQDKVTKYVYPTYRGIRSSNGIPLAASGGGGGGGGGSTTDAEFSASNVTGWISAAVVSGANVVLSVEWESTERGLSTGDGTLSVTNGAGVCVASRGVSQGRVDLNVSQYLTTGANTLRVRVADVYDNSKTFVFRVAVVNMSIASNFDDSTAFASTDSILYSYVPVGAVEKAVKFEVDGAVVGTDTTTASGTQQTHSLGRMAHGAHILRVWFEAVVDGQTFSSNVITHTLMVVDASRRQPFIGTPFAQTTATQYETLIIPYRVYTPDRLSSQVTLMANGSVVSTLTVDRTEQAWAYRCERGGTLTLVISSGSSTKTFVLQVAASEIDVEPVTDGLALHLDAAGRSNAEANPGTWRDAPHGVVATLTGFDFSGNGWVTDADGATALRVSGNARAVIPYQPFRSDWRGTGKTIEIEYATHGVLDVSAPVISCLSGERGLMVTPQLVTLASEQSRIETRIKEDEHVRISLVCEKRTENRLLYVYVNGIMSGVVQYPPTDDFSQIAPVGITIGSSQATIDVYHIRVYDNDLTRRQVLANWIADSPTVGLMLERYQHNDVYDEYGQVVIEKLPGDLPYFVLEAEELPQYKGDKKTITGIYVDPADATKSFTFTGCQINVQGTSSAPYARKNYDLQFKSGFEMSGGNHAVSYALAPNVIPFNRFVLKADVASSESANNVELAMLYNEIDPYVRPEQRSNPMVRKGIYGFPIVVFWRRPSTGITQFMGKYNFNLPKRAPEPYGYSGVMESWEFQNNTSDLLLYLTDHFDETMVADPTTGDEKEAWRYDYEARFPSDEWTSYAKLQELQSFVHSTYRVNATNAELDETYVDVDGAEHTHDTSAYRLARFRTEFGNYAEVSSFIFYYIFTELFLMVDSRAKNLFIGFSGSDADPTVCHAIDRKAVAEPYDMDTAIGTNNEGSLVFGFSYEDTDHLQGGADVFNGQNSVLWNNVRDAFPAEITQMYQTLRSAGTLSYATVRQRFEDHQSKWPEAIFNEDSMFKYVLPLTSPDPGKNPTAVYLPMLQGSKAEQRKWWLYNRFRYMDSKWNAGDALSDVIQLRGYAKADITVTPWADVYAAVKYGSYLVSERGAAGYPSTLPCPLSNVNDTEIYVYSASQLSDIGDLSGLKVGFADFSHGTRLQSIKVGDSTDGYANGNLTELRVGQNPMLRTVDASNCTSLSGAVDLTGASGLQHAHFEGTAVTSVALPTGGTMRTLKLPSTVTNLTVVGQANLVQFSMPSYANVTTLRIENCGDAIPYHDVLAAMAAGSRVRIVGFELAVTSTTEVEELYGLLDTMRGLDEAGGNVDVAQVSGTITGLGTVTGEWYDEMRGRYPNIELAYSRVIQSKLHYRTWDGSELLHTESIDDAGNGAYSGAPTREQTAQYTFDFSGWSLERDSDEADPTATASVVGVRTVYAAYGKNIRSYTVTWKDEDDTVLAEETYSYGDRPSYQGATPSHGSDPFTGWLPRVTNVTGDATYKACYSEPVTVKFYSGTKLLESALVLPGNDAEYSGGDDVPYPIDTPGYRFTGWSPAPTNIQENTNCYAQFEDTLGSPVVRYLDGTCKTLSTDGVAATKDYAFYGRRDLATVDLGTTPIVRGQYAFFSCVSLTSLILRASTVASLQTIVRLDGTPIGAGEGKVYVPANLVEAYQSHNGWGDFAIASIE